MISIYNIVLDDGNYEKRHVLSCRKQVIINDDIFGGAICDLMLELTEDEIKEVLENDSDWDRCNHG